MAGRFLQHIWQLWMAITYGATPFEWFALIVSLIVESLFIFVVVLFEGGEWRHRIKARKSLRAIAPLLKEGHRLLATFPMDWNLPTDKTFAWIENVEAWSIHTEERLALVSPLAAMTFSFTPNAGMSGRSAVGKDGRTVHLSGTTGDAYQVFQNKLNNLQQVVAKPEVYL